MFTRFRQGGENHSLRGERRKRCQKDVFMRERLRRSFPVEGKSKKFLGTKVLALKLTVHVRHQLSAQLCVYLYFTERSLREEKSLKQQGDTGSLGVWLDRCLTTRELSRQWSACFGYAAKFFWCFPSIQYCAGIGLML